MHRGHRTLQRGDSGGLVQEILVVVRHLVLDLLVQDGQTFRELGQLLRDGGTLQHLTGVDLDVEIIEQELVVEFCTTTTESA